MATVGNTFSRTSRELRIFISGTIRVFIVEFLEIFLEALSELQSWIF